MTLAALEQAIKSRPKVKLVIIDTLTKFLRVDDTNEFMAVQRSVERLRNLARDHHIHILALAHRKKVSTDDPFDSILGTVAFRAETDTNIIIYHPDNGERVIATETRMGKYIPPTILNSNVINVHGEDEDSVGTDVVTEFSLGPLLADKKAERAAKTERRHELSYEERVIEFLKSCEGQKATQQDVLDEVVGKTEKLLTAIERLKTKGSIELTGTKHSTADPLTLYLIPDALPVNDFLDRMGMKGRPCNKSGEENE